MPRPKPKKKPAPRPKPAAKKVIPKKRVKPVVVPVKVEPPQEPLPHEFLREVALGNVVYSDVIIIRGKETKVNRSPSFKERLYAATQAAAYYAAKLAPKEAPGGGKDAPLDRATLEGVLYAKLLRR